MCHPATAPRPVFRWVLIVALFGGIVGLWCAQASPAAAATRTELTTGERLGNGYNRRWFYVKSGTGSWVPTYANGNAAARGKLMNFRASPGLSSEGRTNALVANLDSYKARGILMITVSLQTTGGWAFSPSGALDSTWMSRAGRLIEAASSRGMVIDMYLFFQSEDQKMNGETAIKTTVKNVADWVRSNNYRNVIIEIANEHNHGGFDYDLIRTDAGVASLVQLAQSRFSGAGWQALVTTSRTGTAKWSTGQLRDVADVALIHGNSTPDLQTKFDRTKAVVNDPLTRGPVVMNEDDNLKNYMTGPLDAAALKDETLTATGMFNAGASWGMMVMPWSKYVLGTDPGINGTGETLASNYVCAVFNHIKGLTGV